eukprot:scaffold5772_cov188-Amphora_coffeaeformis.AAC.7
MIHGPIHSSHSRTKRRMNGDDGGGNGSFPVAHKSVKRTEDKRKYRLHMKEWQYCTGNTDPGNI